MISEQDHLCVNTIRMLSVDCVEKARSGHPGMPMGCAALAYVLWTRYLRHNPSNPKWPDRDRFVLSAGHASALLYSLLHLTGYDLPLEELMNFRQWNSRTPGHPESRLTPGVETTTGPLGQGFANAVGMAIAERFMASRFNRPGHEMVDHYTYVLASDGDLMEGLSHEAASLAGHLRLGKLICIYDDNRITIEGSTDLTFTENRTARFEAYGWHVLEVDDGNDIEAIERAVQAARDEKDRPSFISVRTHIGYGSPGKQDSETAHGEPLGPEEAVLTRERLGWPRESPFYIPEEALKRFRKALEKGRQWEEEWTGRFAAYEKAFPGPARDWRRWVSGELPDQWDKDIPTFPQDAKGMATRVASGTVLNSIAPGLPNLLGGSADLAPSNKTMISGEKAFQAGNYGGRNFHFGVREHGMAAILNGMALHGGLIPYGGTFLIFSDYMRPSIRLAAAMGLKVIYIFTHDSIGLGEDGPTHQPVEHLATLRAIPNLTVIRPCDANETAEAWRFAISHKEGPVALALTRQGVPTLDRTVLAPAEGLRRGGYLLRESRMGKPQVLLIASGSEVYLAIEAAGRLEEKGIPVNVVSMPSWDLFEKQPEGYKKRVMPADIGVSLSIEAATTVGRQPSPGSRTGMIGIDRFGASAPYKILFEKFGITVDGIVEKALQLSA